MEEEPLTVDIEIAAKMLGIGRNLAYSLAKKNEFPVPVLKLGRRIKVPRKPLLELLKGRCPEDKGGKT